MKTIGLVGGMSWESTQQYYKIINETIKRKLGKLHSAKCLIHSFDFEEIIQMQNQENWDGIADAITNASLSLENAGADMILICANTMHKVANQVQERIHIPLINIADATAQKLQKVKIKKVGLVGTKYTMEEGFIKDKISSEYDIDVITPLDSERDFMNKVIYYELCMGIRLPQSKAKFQSIIHNLIVRGAGGIVIGCTETPLFIAPKDISAPVFDTTKIHATAAVEAALEEE